MKMRLQVVVFALALGAVLATERTSYEGHKVYHLHPTAPQLELLSRFDGASGYDFWSRGRVAGASLDIMVSPEEQINFLNFVQQHGITSKLLIEDVQAVFEAERVRQETTPSVEGKITHDKYYRYAEINAYLDEMVAKYPSIASVQTIGKSMVGKLDMKVLKISKAAGNPAIWIDSGIHAREWLAPSMSLYIIDQLLENPANSALLDGVDWYILPVLNPDGYEYSHTTTRMWRKTRSTVTSALCPGVDGNRNFDFHWMEVGASSNPCDDTYGGPVPFSEDETSAVRDFLNANRSQIKLFLTFHAYGEYILYPWGYTSALPSDWRALQSLAEDADRAQQSAGGNAYTIGSSTNVLYAAAGGSDDWAKGVAGIAYSYTIELPGGGATGFDMPASQILKNVREFFEAVRVFGNHVKAGN